MLEKIINIIAPARVEAVTVSEKAKITFLSTILVLSALTSYIFSGVHFIVPSGNLFV